ncbi:MAG: N-acetyltransferase [Candidatus Cloacimonadaceae bacterium]|jgi:ribosomal protein S18 acetylase RimI-like enzyme
MKDNIIIYNNKSGLDDLIIFFNSCTFNPALLNYINNINQYCNKLYTLSQRYEVWDISNLVALIAVYENKFPNAYIPIVGVIDKFRGKGLGDLLLNYTLKQIEHKGFTKVSLEVYSNNIIAINLYRKYGFIISKENSTKIHMVKTFIN